MIQRSRRTIKINIRREIDGLPRNEMKTTLNLQELFLLKTPLGEVPNKLCESFKL